MRVDSVAADDGLGKRIRTSKMEKIPYMLVVGDDDVAADTVGVNLRRDMVAATRSSAASTLERVRRRFADEVVERFRAEVDDA